MRTPPPIPMPVIAEAVQKAHRIDASVFTFVRGSESTWGFNLAGTSGAYRLTVYPNNRHVERQLEAAHHLHHNLGLSFVVAPIRRPDNGLVFDVAGREAALFPYIFAASASAVRLTPAHGIEFGRILARLHAASPHTLALPTEDFSAATGDITAGLLAELPRLTADAGQPLRQSFADSLASAADHLRRDIDSLNTLAERLRSARLPFVACHSAPLPNHILTGDDLHLTDWENLCIATRERDLMHFEPHDPLWQGYREIAGDISLNPDALRYYRIEWTLGIINGISRRVFFEEASDAHLNHDLAQLRNFLRSSGMGDMWH